MRPDLAAEWHPTMNGALKPLDVKPTYDKPVVAMLARRRLEMTLRARQRGRGCSVCAGKVVNLRTRMATTHPHLARKLDDELNGGIIPFNVVAGGITRSVSRVPVARRLPRNVQPQRERRA